MLNIIKLNRFFGNTQRNNQRPVAAQTAAHHTNSSIESTVTALTPDEEDLSKLTPEQRERKLQLRAMYTRMAERQAVVEAEDAAERLWN